MRSKIIAILFLILEMGGFIGVGIFMYHKVPVPINKTKDFTVHGKDGEGRNVITFKTACPLCSDFHINQKIRITDEQLQKVKETQIVLLPWKDVHFSTWFILYWSLFVFGVFSAIACFIYTINGCYENNYPYRYECTHDCFFMYRCRLYNKADEVNLEPVRNKWFNFWGYETS